MSESSANAAQPEDEFGLHRWSPSPHSGYLIGDAEREAAVEQLREHMVAGRLTAEEFQQRMSKALEARTTDDLISLFTDLPADPVPTQLVPADGWAAPAVPADAGSSTIHTAATWTTTAMWVTLALAILTPLRLWELFIVLAIVSAILRSNDPQGRQRRQRRRKQMGEGYEWDGRQLDR